MIELFSTNIEDYIKEDSVEVGTAELLSQYSESRNFKLYLQALLLPFEELEAVHKELQYMVTLDDAIGDGLSAIGALIGRPRNPIERPDEYFGWRGIVGAEPFGTIGDPSIGAPFKTNQDNFKNINVVPVNDDEYRPMLYSQLVVNTTSLSINDMRKVILGTIQSQTDLVIEEGTKGNGSYKVTFPDRLTHVEKNIIARRDLPKPAGIEVDYADIDGDIVYF